MAAYEQLYEAAKKDPEKFWGDLARKELHWFKPFDKVLEWKEPFAKWFVGGKTNVSYNCLDAHLTPARRNKAAIIWEGEPGDQRTLTYQQLHREVCKFANVLKELGREDRATWSRIYMPMMPELAIAMLACARIGAVALRDLRRLLRRSHRRPQQRRQGQVRHHGRRRLAAGQAAAAEEDGRRGPGEIADRRSSASSSSGPANDVTMKAGRDHLVARADGRGVRRLPRRAARQRSTRCSSSTPAAAPASRRGFGTRRRATTCSARRRSSGSSTIATKTSTGARPTAAGSPGTATSSTARSSAGATVDDVRRGAQLARRGPLLGHHREVPRQHSLHGPDGHSGVHQVGRSARREARPVEPAPARHASAKGSIPKPGCGITARSAANAARSSIPGGRPKPAAS